MENKNDNDDNLETRTDVKTVIAQEIRVISRICFSYDTFTQ